MTSLLHIIIQESPLLKHLSNIQHRSIHDIQQNFEKTFNSPILHHKSIAIIAIATCINEKNSNLYQILLNNLSKNLVSENEISEIHAIVSIMNMNNAMYSFKNKLNNPVYLNYPIGLNMSSFSKTILDKSNFELIALTISNLNQCKPCTVHHEQKCIDLQISSEEVYKAIQLSSFVKSLCVFDYLAHP